MKLSNIDSIAALQKLRDEIMQDRGALEAAKYLAGLGHLFQADLISDWVHVRSLARDESIEAKAMEDGREVQQEMRAGLDRQEELGS